MNRKILIPLLLLLLCLPALTMGQAVSLQVVAVKGTVKYQSKVLKKDDIISVSNLSTLPSSLNYGSAADWVNFLNKKDRKIINYYASKSKTPDGKYMFSRGAENKEVPPSWQIPGVKHLQGDKEVISYFDRPMIFMFGNDTLVCSGMKVYEIRNGNGFMLEYSIDSTQCSASLGISDTLFVTRTRIFPNAEAKTEVTLQNSYNAGPMKLVYFNKTNNEKNYLNIDEFNIYFLEDVVLGMRRIGMSNKNICTEITYVFSSQEQLEAISGLKEQKAIEKWVMKKIKKIR